MSTIRLEVVTSQRTYPIHIGKGLAPAIAETCRELEASGRKVAVLVDAELERHQPAFLKDAFGALPRCTIPSGEGSKCFQELARCCEFLAEQRIDRGGALFAVGGGVTGDLAGFVAASFLRGIDFYQVPSTLLSMVDSSVGGKTGINLKAGKNLVGAFHQPVAVFADVSLLGSLPPREFSAGMAEVIKHGLLADADLFERLEKMDTPLSPEHPDLADVVRANCAIKSAVVAADEKENAVSGGRALLNLGHTFGHAIEAVAGYGHYLHGEAIGVGLVLAARLSEKLGYIDAGAFERVRVLVARYQLPTSLREPLSLDALMAAMSRDKKVRDGKLKFVALHNLGQAITVQNVPTDLVRSLWTEVGAA